MVRGRKYNKNGRINLIRNYFLERVYEPKIRVCLVFYKVVALFLLMEGSLAYFLKIKHSLKE